MDARLASTLANVFGLHAADIHEGLTRTDIDSWDSLKQMDLLLSLEREYTIALDVSEIVRMTSVGAIIDVLREKGASLED